MIPVRRALPLLALVAAGLALPADALAGQRNPQPLVRVQPVSTAFKDRVTTSLPVRARAAAASPFRAYRAPDGTTIAVRFDAAYRADPTTAQTYVDYLGSLPHGSELGKLKLVLAPPAQVQQECGGVDGVLACYDG